jgi:hypothetical protein
MTEKTTEEALAEAIDQVARLPPSPGIRELRSRLDQYRRVVQAWATIPPGDEQRRALREQVDEVLRIVRSTAPTLRRRPLKKRPESE